MTEPTTPQSDLDILMTHIATINSKSPHEITDRDITILIGYHRHSRAQRAAGIRQPKFAKPTVDVNALLGVVAPAKPALGLRRI